MLPGQENPRLERVRFELRATGVKPGQTLRPLHTGLHTRGYLPHVKREGARYFVTFRLADSLPHEVLLKIQAERARRLAGFYAQAEHARKLGIALPATAALEDIEREYFRKLEAYLDKGCGACWLKQPALAELVAGALQYFEGQRYQLKAWVVMPNHVHAVVWPMSNFDLSGIVHSWKGYTARQANLLLQRTGQAFWQPEPFDHWIRNDAECERCCRYVHNNPVKARLCTAPEEWKWSSAWHEPKAK